MPCVTPLRLAVTLDGAGWHPAARPAVGADGAEPRGPLPVGYWTDLVQEAERGKLDFVSLEDRPGLDRLAPGDPAAALIAAEVAALTSRIGLIPTLGSAEPFDLASAIATLDHASSGRAGWQPRIGPANRTLGAASDPAGDKAINRAIDGAIDAAVDAAVDVLEAVRRFWDSGPDGATARPPQGQPVILARADAAPEYRFAARAADLVVVTPSDDDDARRVVGAVRAAESDTGRTGPGLRIFADLAVFLDDTDAAAADRKARLDDLHEAEFTSDTAIFVGTPNQLVRRLQAWQRAGIEGFRLRPGALPHDLRAITRGLVPALQENDAFRRGYEARTLRSLLGMPRATPRAA